jgi:hypothetical protein
LTKNHFTRLLVFNVFCTHTTFHRIQPHIYSPFTAAHLSSAVHTNTYNEATSVFHQPTNYSMEQKCRRNIFYGTHLIHDHVHETSRMHFVLGHINPAHLLRYISLILTTVSFWRLELCFQIGLADKVYLIYSTARICSLSHASFMLHPSP